MPVEQRGLTLETLLVHTFLSPACGKLVGQSHSGDLYLAGMSVAAEAYLGPEACRSLKNLRGMGSQDGKIIFRNANKCIFKI